MLVNDQPGPERLGGAPDLPDGTAPRGTWRSGHISTGRYVGSTPTGCSGWSTTPTRPPWLTMDVVESGAAAAAALGAPPRTSPSWWSATTRWSTAARPRTAPTWRCPPAQEAVRPGGARGQPARPSWSSPAATRRLTWADAHVPAVLWSSHGGQEYGHALAEVLFGDADPRGGSPRPGTARRSELPDLLDYDIIATDATYLYYRGTPLYPFGHGLSYTTFDYSGLTVASRTATRHRHGHRHQHRLPPRRSRSSSSTPTSGFPGQAAAAQTPRIRPRRPPPRRIPPLRVRIDFPIHALAIWDVTRSRFVVEDAPAPSTSDAPPKTCGSAPPSTSPANPSAPAPPPGSTPPTTTNTTASCCAPPPKTAATRYAPPNPAPGSPSSTWTSPPPPRKPSSAPTPRPARRTTPCTSTTRSAAPPSPHRHPRRHRPLRLHRSPYPRRQRHPPTRPLHRVRSRRYRPRPDRPVLKTGGAAPPRECRPTIRAHAMFHPKREPIVRMKPSFC